MLKLLIDGHNLIGKMPGLSLADIDDEENLVAMLRKYAMRRRARIVVVFDSGSPGGRSHELSGGGVEAVFAANGHTNADRVIIERIREVKRPQEWAVVSGDRSIQHEAKRRRMRVIESAAFARQLAPPETAEPTRQEKPLPDDDIEEWFDLFNRR